MKQSELKFLKRPSEPSFSSVVSNSKIEVDDVHERFIILIDMDAYYAQVEMKKHNIDPSKPVIV